MNNTTLVVVGVILAVAVISGGLAYLRAESFSTPNEISSKGLAAIRRGQLIFYGVLMPLLVGVISYFVYRRMSERGPDSTQTSFLLLAIGIAVGFTLLAAIVFKMRGFAEFVALHVLYTSAFGWIMPILLAR